MRNILESLSFIKDNVGYCQGMNFIAAALLEVAGALKITSTIDWPEFLISLGALGIALVFNDNLRLQVTPEYDFGISKSSLCKKVSENDSKFKSWTDGFNLCLTLMVYL